LTQVLCAQLTRDSRGFEAFCGFCGPLVLLERVQVKWSLHHSRAFTQPTLDRGECPASRYGRCIRGTNWRCGSQSWPVYSVCTEPASTEPL